MWLTGFLKITCTLSLTDPVYKKLEENSSNRRKVIQMEVQEKKKTQEIVST